MAQNNQALFDAAVAGCSGGDFERWLTATASNDYVSAFDAIVAFSTAVDAAIPTLVDEISESEINLLQSIVQGVVSTRYLRNASADAFADIAESIAAAFEEGRSRLNNIPAPGAGITMYLPTGQADEQAYFQQAINRAVATTALMWVAAGVVNLSLGGCTIPGPLRLLMSPNTTLDISQAGSVNALYATGTESAPSLLTANAAVGATSISVDPTFAATLTERCWIRVASNAIWDPFDTNTKIGEQVQVKSIAGAVVTLETPLRGGPYQMADAAAASLIVHIENIVIDGGKVLGGGTLTQAGVDADCNGVVIFKGKNCKVLRTEFNRCDLSSVWFQDSLFCTVDDAYFENAINDNQGYGVLFDNTCQDCDMVHCKADRVRHLFTTGNSTTTRGIVRRITFQENKIYSTVPARGGTGGDALDTHAGAEDISIIDNTVYSSSGGGCNVECPSCTIRGNEIYNTVNYGIIFHNESNQNGQVTIEDNRVVNAGIGGTWEGIRVNNPTRGAGANVAFNESVRVEGNEVISPSGMGIYIVNSLGASTTLQKNLSVVGNTVFGSKSNSASIYLEDCRGFTISGNVVVEPTSLAQQCFLIRDCYIGTVGDNAVYVKDGSSSIGFYCNSSTAGKCHDITFGNNIVYGEAAVNLRGIYIDDTAQFITVGINSFNKCTQQVRRGTGTGNNIYNDATLSVTIASDAIAININVSTVVVDTEGGAASDTVSTITGGQYGQIVVFRSANSARQVVFTEVGGNILMGANFTLATTDDTITLQYTTSNQWRRIASATN